jgi:NAD(P)-dependent dehydrogenase (short-subunit alcohol dehydrogenase family)
MHQDWKTQNIVITGAASGLGRALCARFAHLDASVRGIDVNKAQLQELKAALGENFIPVICDVANWEEVVQVFDQFPSIDVLEKLI